MKKHNFVFAGAFAIVSIMFLSCDGVSSDQNPPEHPDKPAEPEVPETPKETVVYAVGQEIVPDKYHYYAAVWKDGRRFYLTDGVADGFCNAVSSEGDNIYVVGCEAVGDLVDDGYYEPYHQNVGILWEFKAGEETNVKRTVLSDGKLATSPLSVSVSGGNVYIAGTETLESGNRKAIYWKNGKMKALSDGISDAVAYCILTVGDDVYVGGYEASQEDGKKGTAKIWKNGVARNLTDGTTLAKVNALYYENGILYAAGAEKAAGEHWKGVLWKDGTATYFHTESEAIVTDIYVKDEEYIIGGGSTDPEGNYVPCIWTKDGIEFVSDKVSLCEASAMDVTGNDVYIAGNEYSMDYETYEESYTAYLWKNGEEIKLEASTDDTSIWDIECASVTIR